MISEILPLEKEMSGSVKSDPCISIILPFEPKMARKTELVNNVRKSYEKAEKELLANCSGKRAIQLLTRLNELIKNLDYSTYKRSIAILVSQHVQKTYYFDFPVKERVICGESFNIHDLVNSKKELHTYLLLVVNTYQSRIFLGDMTQLTRLVSNAPEQLPDYMDAIAAQPANRSDAYRQNPTIPDKFLRYIDNGLSIVLKAYPLPLFIMGTGETTNRIKEVSRNKNHISGYICGNFEQATESEIRRTIKPYISDWKKIKRQYLFQQLDKAGKEGKLTVGLEKVWEDVSHKKGRLLIVERNYGDNKGRMNEMMEKVLENGGEVEFVDENALDAWQQIALLK